MVREALEDWCSPVTFKPQQQMRQAATGDVISHNHNNRIILIGTHSRTTAATVNVTEHAQPAQLAPTVVNKDMGMEEIFKVG